MIRVVVAGMGVNSGANDPGTELATELRNGGMEAIFTGWNQAPEQVVRGALQEDADAIGVCNGTAAVLSEIRGLLADEDAADILVFASTISPEAVVEWVQEHLAGE